MLPLVTYFLTASPMSDTGVMMVFTVFICFPTLIILFLRPQKIARSADNTVIDPKKWPDAIQKPTIASFSLNLLLVLFLIFVGALPVIFWLTILALLTHPNCKFTDYSFANLFDVAYCIIKR
jgi:magnesium-transporting ATPase (P-type)